VKNVGLGKTRKNQFKKRKGKGKQADRMGGGMGNQKKSQKVALKRGETWGRGGTGAPL